MKNVFSTLLLSEKKQCAIEIHVFDTIKILSVNIDEQWLSVCVHLCEQDEK